MWPVVAKIPLPFKDGSLTLSAFGLMVVLAFLAGSFVMKRLARREGILDERKLENLFLWILAAIVVGARALYVLTNLHEFQGRWIDVIRIDKGGMTMYGALLLGASVAWLQIRRYGLPTWPLLDAGAVGAALGLGIGRIGCLLVGDDYGKECSADFPLRIKFSTRQSPGEFLGITIPANNGNLAGDHAGLWLHPTQVYMSINGFLLAVVLYWLWKRKTFHGQIFAAFFFLKAVTRSVIEVFRDDSDRGWVGPLSTSQFIGLVTAVGAVALWLVLSRRPDCRAGLPRAPSPG